MIERLKALLSGPRQEVEDDTGALRLAVGALLVEAAQMDANFDEQERQTIATLLARRFSLGDEEARQLVETAEAQAEDSEQLYSFTRTVKDELDHEERIELMEMLWQVAYADGELHHYEANLMRRLAGLLYISDRESGAARKRVMARLGSAA